MRDVGLLYEVEKSRDPRRPPVVPRHPIAEELKVGTVREARLDGELELSQEIFG